MFIFKSDDETDPNNYRPISLLSNYNSIYENIMYKIIIDFIEKKRSFVYFSIRISQRAFDSTCHFGHCQHYSNQYESRFIFVWNFNRRQKSLRHRQPRYRAHRDNRMQTTQIGQHVSNKATVTCGVPQGSVLGPLFFYCMLMICINVQINSNFIFSVMILISSMVTRI